jgi:hypothetical protein
MRPIARLIPLLALATTLSCADMPIAPRGIVTVTGLITDRDGPGIEQAHIEFYSLDPRDQSSGGFDVIVAGSPRSAKVNSSTVTDGTGHYRLSLPAGPYMVFLEPERGYPYVLFRKVDIAPGHTELNYHYTGVRITGTMKGPNGLPLTQASVRVYGDGPENTYAASDLVGDQYSLLVPAGTYLVRAGAFGTFGLPAIRTQLTVARDTTIDFVLDGILVTGSVRGQNGVPLERIRVIASASSEEDIYTYTLVDGTYTMYLPAATYLWRLVPWFDSMSYIAGRDYPPVSISAPTTLDFDMSGVEWSGTVRRTSDSTAVSNADVAALELRSDYSYNAAQTRSDGVGQFRLIVGRGLYYNLFAEYGARPVGTFATSADTTFNIYVDAPPLP